MRVVSSNTTRIFPISGRKTGGFSMRQSLIDQGVTSEEAIRGHLALLAGTIQVVPLTDITRYRVSKSAPNHVSQG